MSIKTVAVCGASGVLGSQIAIQVAVNGFKVKAWCLNDKEIQQAKARMRSYAVRYAKEAADPVSEEEGQKAAAGIEFSCDLGEALQDADLVIEAIVENFEIKRNFYQDVAKLHLPEETLLATNSSSLRPSDMMDATGRPDRFFAMHFQNEIWAHNAVEIMGCRHTDRQHLKTAEEFCRQIKTQPFVLNKEQAGYIINTQFMPFVNTSLFLWGSGLGSPWEIDQAWIKATGAPGGPFAMIDIVGFNTPAEIIKNHLESGELPQRMKPALDYVSRFLKDMFRLKRGGKLHGEGFYHYQDKPEFLHKEFFEGVPDISENDFGKVTGDKEKDKFILLFTVVLGDVFEGTLELLAKEVAPVKDVQRVWQISSGFDWSPVGAIRKIGTQRVYAYFKAKYELEGRSHGVLERKILERLAEGV